MENKNIIIILLIVIVILAAALGVMLLSQSEAKPDTKIAITSNVTLHEGDKLKIKLTDINGTGISNQTVNVTITDGDGVSSHFSVVTNSKGIGTLKLDKDAGNYTVNCTYGGNDKYAGNSTSKKLTIEEGVVETPVYEQSSSQESSQESSYPSGLTDEEIDAYIQRDLNERAKNGVDGSYDYEGAKDFYRNVPPTGMV